MSDTLLGVMSYGALWGGRSPHSTSRRCILSTGLFILHVIWMVPSHFVPECHNIYKLDCFIFYSLAMAALLSATSLNTLKSKLNLPPLRYRGTFICRVFTEALLTGISSGRIPCPAYEQLWFPDSLKWPEQLVIATAG